MSSIDFGRLVIERTYFVPIKETELYKELFKELTDSYPPMGNIKPWLLIRNVKRGFHLIYSTGYTYVHDAAIGFRQRVRLDKIIEEKSEEYENKLPDVHMKTVSSLRGNIPFKLIVSNIRPEKEGCTCNVKCFPVLYEKLSLEIIGANEVDEFDVQDAIITCESFVEDIFTGLSATLTSEKRKESLKLTAQLLINDQVSHQILDKMEAMLDQATADVLLCGWMGTLLLPKLQEMKQKGVDIRVVTHKAKELKGKPGHQDVQRAFRELVSMLGKDNISIRPECHCRVVIVDNKALIGSMDLNAISLTGSHRELAIYTEDPEIVRNVRNYFNGIFSPLSKEKER